MLLPALMIGAHRRSISLILWLQKHTQLPGGRAHARTTSSGRHFWPGQVFRSLGLFFLTAAVLAAVAGLVQINPVWVYGPFVPYVGRRSPAQPDWYVGWLEGALRLGPPFEPTILGVTIPSPFVPGILMPGDRLRRLHAVAVPRGAASPTTTTSTTCSSTPWQAPVRTAIGAAALTLLPGPDDRRRQRRPRRVLPGRTRAADVGSPVPGRRRPDRGRSGRLSARDRTAPPRSGRGRDVSAARRTIALGRHRRSRVGGMPAAPATTEGHAVSDLWTIFLVAAAIVGGLVWGLITSSIIRYRRRRSDTSSGAAAQTVAATPSRSRSRGPTGPILDRPRSCSVMTLFALQRIDAREAGGDQRQRRSLPLAVAVHLPDAGVTVTGDT